MKFRLEVQKLSSIFIENTEKYLRKTKHLTLKNLTI